MLIVSDEHMLTSDYCAVLLLEKSVGYIPLLCDYCFYTVASCENSSEI
jgi:hypothetical protein